MCICGIDEAGRGPVIGPMVMAMVCADSIDFYVNDSKLLTKHQRSLIFNDVSRLYNKYYIIKPVEIDNAVKKHSLNLLEVNYALKLISEAECEKIYIDCFDVNESRLENILKMKSQKEIICKHHADRDFKIVSAASIVAKFIRDLEIEKLKDIYGDFGSGYPSDPKTVKFIKDSLIENKNIDDIIRREWKTYKNLIQGHI